MGPPAHSAFPEANPPPPGWAIFYDDAGRLYRRRTYDGVSAWDNPFVLAEIIVNYHWRQSEYMPAPYEHCIPSVAILAIAYRTADEAAIWRWAVIQAAHTRTQWHADIAAGRANSHTWYMPNRHQIALERWYQRREHQPPKTMVPQQPQAVLLVRNPRDMLDPRSIHLCLRGCLSPFARHLLCNSCHSSLSLHGDNRTDDIDGCVTCHNPRNTDKRVREIANDPPTDGKDEESIDFKTMIHGIHAAAMRENPLEIVGFRGFSTHRYTQEQVHYPGDLANCTACHTASGYTLPLANGVLGTSIDTGDDRADPTDDVVVTPASAACSSCHDNNVAKSHMESNGGSFSTTQSAIDSGEVVEECAVCHAQGRSADVSAVHSPR